MDGMDGWKYWLRGNALLLSTDNEKKSRVSMRERELMLASDG